MVLFGCDGDRPSAEIDVYFMDRVKAAMSDSEPKPMQIQRSGPRRFEASINQPMAMISSDLDGLISLEN